MIVQLARINPKVGPEKAMEVLKRVETEFGDQPALRLDKADILIQMNKDQQDKEPLKRELANLFAGIDQWTTAQKIELWGGMAGRYLSLNMPEEGRQYLTLAADNQPNELPLRLALFSLALDAGDDDGMKEAQAKILEIVGDRSDSAWLFAEARRKLLLLRRGRLGPEALDEIRTLANQALQQRPDWFELEALLAEIEMLSNHGALALAHYDRAEELGGRRLSKLRPIFGCWPATAATRKPASCSIAFRKGRGRHCWGRCTPKSCFAAIKRRRRSSKPRPRRKTIPKMHRTSIGTVSCWLVRHRPAT